MREIPLSEAAPLLEKQMAEGGVFMCTAAGGVQNVLTIGWGGLNVFFGHPCILAPVRESRHSFTLLAQNPAFTLSVPLHDMRAQLAFAGSRSGRDVNKFEGHGLTAAPAQAVNVPIVAECELQLECEPMGRVAFQADQLPGDVLARFYPTQDMHTLFLGRIVKCYLTV